MTAVCWWVIGQTVLKAGRVPLLGAAAATSWDSIIKAQGSLSNSASAGSMQESPHLVRLGFLFLSLAKSENTVNSQKKHHYILGMKYKYIFIHIHINHCKLYMNKPLSWNLQTIERNKTAKFSVCKCCWNGKKNHLKICIIIEIYSSK